MKTKWFIAYKRRGKDLLDLSQLKRWETPEGQYEADPFLLKKDGINYLFYELWDYKKGVIACSTIDSSGISEPQVVLEEPHHLSYPLVFGEDGKMYMLPEQGASMELRLYRATKFPTEWEVANVILQDLYTTDNSLFKHGNSWWLFISGDKYLGHPEILRSDAPDGRWEPHHSGSHKNFRAAGRVFEMGGKLIRPVQDSDKTYGKAIIFKEITLPEYSEQVIRRIEPDWYPGIIGTHTFNFNEDFVVLDGKLKIPK